MGKEKVSFWAKKKVPEPVRVKFITKNGQEVSFRAVKKIPKPIKVEFYAKEKERK